MIFTAALQAIDKSMIDLMRRQSRKPTIVADAAYAILCQNSRNFRYIPHNSRCLLMHTFSGNFCIDEDVLRYQGVGNFDQYAMTPGSTELVEDGYIDEGYKTPRTPDQVLLIKSKL